MNAEHESDEQLMADVAWGNREPLGRLVRRYGSPLLTFIQRMIGDRHRSKELFQDVFLAVWDKRHSYRYPKPFRAWLFAIVPQQVDLKLADAEWFERLEEGVQTVRLDAAEVRQVSFRIRARRAGRHELLVHAEGRAADDAEAPEDAAAETVADAIRRSVEVEPEGRPVEQVFSGTLRRPAEIGLRLPPEAVAESARLTLRIYPSSFSQLLEGLEAIFRRPYGCFEQTSSTTYPNVLALDYLQRTGQSVPAVEATARQYIHLGYQRLLTFEASGGGFEWFGGRSGSGTLTAYGLMQFEDMARVHDVDPALLERTRRWLLAHRRPDGSWRGDGGRPGKDEAALAATAYIAWAVFRDGRGAADARPTLEYLLDHEPAAIDSPYVAALVANALSGLEPGGNAPRPYLERLEQTKRQSPDGSLVWWEQPSGARTVFHGSGRSGDVEATALATLAMLEAGGSDATVQGALNWLIEQKDARGTWHSTQATVLALKALLAGTETAFGGDRAREIEVAAAGKILHRLSIPADEGDVVREVGLTPLLTDSDALRLTLTERSGTASGYQVVLSYRIRDERPLKVQDEPLSIVLDYDRTDLAVGETVAAVATVTNRRPAAAPMVIVELPIPPGFAIETADLDELVAGDDIARFEVSPRSAILYLRELPPRRSLVLRYRLRATMPVKATAAPARAYEYYDPDTVAMTDPVAFVVAEAVEASVGN